MAGLKIKKGDNVRVIAGKDRGKTGRVVRVWPDEGKVLVEGVNQVKRHEKIRVARGRGGQEGGIITKEAPVRVSNVAVVCPSCSQATRVGYELTEGGEKRRVCRKCGGNI